MKLNFAKRDVVRFKNQAEEIQRRARRALARTDEPVGAPVGIAEIGAAAFLFGLAQGKFGGVAVEGPRIDVLSTLALHILSFAGIPGAESRNFCGLADGLLASYLNDLGRSVGRSLQSDADRDRIAGSGVHARKTAGGVSLVDEELARMVRAGRGPETEP